MAVATVSFGLEGIGRLGMMPEPEMSPSRRRCEAEASWCRFRYPRRWGRPRGGGGGANRPASGSRGLARTPAPPSNTNAAPPTPPCALLARQIYTSGSKLSAPSRPVGGRRRAGADTRCPGADHGEAHVQRPPHAAKKSPREVLGAQRSCPEPPSAGGWLCLLLLLQKNVQVFISPVRDPTCRSSTAAVLPRSCD